MISIQNRERANLPQALIDVPTFPAVAIKALQAISKEHSQLRELSDLIATDAALSGVILRMANSALFGTRTEVSSIFQSILMFGLERIKRIVATTAMKGYLGDSLEVPVLRACWRHSLACAVIAEELARKGLMEADVAYTAGLMHDIGRLALVAAYPRKYADFLKSVETEPCDALQLERGLFGIDHCQAGRILVSHWNLPKTFIAITSQHHNAATIGEPAMLSTVRRSCAMADALGFHVVYPLQPRNYEEILSELPERERLTRDPSELACYIASKINSIECA